MAGLLVLGALGMLLAIVMIGYYSRNDSGQETEREAEDERGPEAESDEIASGGGYHG